MASWQLTGRVDGMTADRANDRIIATVNEDGNTSLYTISPDAAPVSQLTHYTYSPNPPVHGGGTDAPVIYHGMILITASSPSDTIQPAVYSASLSGTTATLTPVFADDATAIVANTNSSLFGQTVTLGVTDPDSNFVVPSSSPRFAGDFALDAQGDLQQVFVHNAGGASQKLWVLNLTQAVNDTVWITASTGTLFVTDPADNEVFALQGHFEVGTAFTAATPANANNPPPPPSPNYLARLDLNTGSVTAVTGLPVPVQAKGLAFVPAGG